MASQPDPDPNQLMGEYEFLRKQVENLGQNLEVLEASLVEMRIVKDSLGKIEKEGPENEVLVPIGGDSFLKAKITDTENVIQGIGAGVSVKKTTAQAEESLGERIEKYEKLREDTTKRLQEGIGRLEEITPVIQQLSAQAQAPR